MSSETVKTKSTQVRENVMKAAEQNLKTPPSLVVPPPLLADLIVSSSRRDA